MIDKLEIADLARELSLDLHVVEKDYVLGWLLAGITANPELSENWVFKGGTCLKKCYFETYRFSEDLDFTVTEEAQLDEQYLLQAFRQMAEWIYEQSGIEIPEEQIRFKLSVLEGGRYVEGRVYYIGPLMQKRNLARIKFDLTGKEKLVLPPQKRVAHHPYSDCPDDGIHVLSYCFEEVFAEKMRALATQSQKMRALALRAPAFQGGFADLPALGQLVLGDASSVHVGVLPQVLPGLYERAVRGRSQAEVLP